jgi:hypothetical protein
MTGLVTSLGSALVGTAVPLAVLVVIVRWRLSQETPSGPLLSKPPVSAAEAGGARLYWLWDTIGAAPSAPVSPQSTTRSCPRCGYRPTEAAYFCRGCGTRLPERQQQ